MRDNQPFSSRTGGYSSEFAELYCYGIRNSDKSLRSFFNVAEVDYCKLKHKEFFSAEEMTRISETVFSRYDDNFLLMMPKPYTGTHAATLARLLCGCRDFSEALSALKEFHILVDLEVRSAYDYGPQESIYFCEVNPKRHLVPKACLDFLMMMKHTSRLALFCVFLGLKRFPVLHMSLSQPYTKETELHVRSFCSGKISWGQHANFVSFDSNLLKCIRQCTNDDIHDALQSCADAFPTSISKLEDDTFQHKLQLWMEREIKSFHRAPCIKRAGSAMGLHPKTISRTLAKQGTSFRVLRQSSVMLYASNLLLTTQFNVDKVSRIVGFSDASAFVRSFKNHHKMSPSMYRQSKQKQMLHTNEESC